MILGGFSSLHVLVTTIPRRTGEWSLSSFNMASKGNSVFSRIIRRELPATFLHEDDQVNQERCVTRTLILHRLHSHL